MSAKLWTLVALVALATPDSAPAQTTVGVSAGASSPIGQYGDNLTIGYHVMGSVSYLPPLAPIGFRLDGMFNEFEPGSAVFHGKARVLAVTGNAVLTAPGVMGPYLVGGVGLYKNSTSVTTSATVSTTTTTNDIGYNAGAGLRFGLSGFSAFMELRFHMAGSEATKPRYLPITFGVTF